MQGSDTNKNVCRRITVVKDSASQHPIILFDGVCNLCNGMVKFIILRDARGQFQFASLQSTAAQNLLEAQGVSGDVMDTVMLLDGQHVYSKSDAVLHMFRGLSGRWPILFYLVVIPKPIRDFVYDLVAKYRYRLFGKRDTCMIPTEAIRSRFKE